MKRRHALKYIGTGISAGLILPSWLTSCSPDDPKPAVNYKGKVAVIGAGAAGLYAADYLISKGLEVTVYEASNRIGGRLRSLRKVETPSPGLIVPSTTTMTNDYPLELGADRIFGSDSILAEFVARRKFPTVPFPAIENDRYFRNDVLKNYNEMAADADFIQAKAFYDNIKDYAGGDVSVDQAIQSAGINSELYSIMNGWIGALYGSDNNRISAAGLAEGLQLRTRIGGDLLFKSAHFVDIIANLFSRAVSATKLNTPITNINYSGEKIVLSGTQNGEAFTSEVDKVIIAVPVSVLKAGDIAFTPALPAEKIAAMSNMGMDAMIKVILDFRRNFWQDDETDPELRFIYGGTKATQYFNAGVGRGESRKILSATIIGSKAEEMSALGIGVVDELLAELDGMFIDAASAEIRTDEADNKVVAVQDWLKEPYIKGGLSYLKPGGTNADREILGAPVNDRLFFAGEATDSIGEFGNINGALQSAERVVQELVTVVTSA